MQDLLLNHRILGGRSLVELYANTDGLLPERYVVHADHLNGGIVGIVPRRLRILVLHTLLECGGSTGELAKDQQLPENGRNELVDVGIGLCGFLLKYNNFVKTGVN